MRVVWLVLLGTLGAAAQPARGQAAPASDGGRITGTVELITSAPRRPRIRVYGDAVAPPRRPEPGPEILNVVVYLESVPPGTAPGPGAAATQIAQVNEAFVPRVIAVVKGATVQFPNRDPIFHNVFSLSSARSFDLGRYPQGESRSVRFDKAGVVPVFCHIHADMSAVILVLENPWHVRPDTAGRFTLDGVPPGEYRLVAWHERVRPVGQTVRIAAGGTATVTMRLPLAESAPAR